MTCQNQNMKQHAKVPQKLANQGPVYDRKLKVHRPNKRKLKGKWV